MEWEMDVLSSFVANDIPIYDKIVFISPWSVVRPHYNQVKYNMIFFMSLEQAITLASNILTQWMKTQQCQKKS